MIIPQRFRKLWWWLRYRGPGPTVSALARRVLEEWSGKLHARLLHEASLAQAYDARHHVDTSGHIAANAHALDEQWADRVRQATEYVGVDADSFNQTLRRLQADCDLDLRSFTFVDYGSGKGKALFLASSFPFRSIVGVELMPVLHAAAQANIATYVSDDQVCHDLASVCLDAGMFIPPDGPLLVFLFNPFGPSVMGDVIRNLIASHAARPRPLYVLYSYPVFENMFRSAGFQRLFGDRWYAALRLPPA